MSSKGPVTIKVNGKHRILGTRSPETGRQVSDAIEWTEILLRESVHRPVAEGEGGPGDPPPRQSKALLTNCFG